MLVESHSSSGGLFSGLQRAHVTDDFVALVARVTVVLVGVHRVHLVRYEQLVLLSVEASLLRKSDAQASLQLLDGHLDDLGIKVCAHLALRLDLRGMHGLDESAHSSVLALVLFAEHEAVGNEAPVSPFVGELHSLEQGEVLVFRLFYEADAGQDHTCR